MIHGAMTQTFDFYDNTMGSSRLAHIYRLGHGVYVMACILWDTVLLHYASIFLLYYSSTLELCRRPLIPSEHMQTVNTSMAEFV